jgi:hypothetical protein
MFIPDPDFFPFPDPGQKSPGSRIQIRNTVISSYNRGSIPNFVFKEKRIRIPSMQMHRKRHCTGYQVRPTYRSKMKNPDPVWTKPLDDSVQKFDCYF